MSEVNNKSNNKDIVVGLDIGTTKICAIVGRRGDDGKMSILGVGRAESSGVLRGVVANIDRTVEAIRKAVGEAEAKSGHKIKDVYVGIAGQHIKSLQHSHGQIRVDPDKEISEDEVDRLIQEMYRIHLAPGEKVINVLPQDFTVDNEKGIRHPIGMAGTRIDGNFHVITGLTSAIKNIMRCVDRAGLTVRELILEPLASAAAVLSEEEKEAGVALVDIGGGTTDVAIFQDSVIRHTAVIPFGGNSITDDIREGCMIMRNQAELLKVKFGCALAVETRENEIVSIPGLRGREPREISTRNLANIIQARMEEIMEAVYYEIRHSGYEKQLIGGIVVTGGGSQMRHIKQLIDFITGLDARVGIPVEHLAQTSDSECKSPVYSTAIGLVQIGMQDRMAEPVVEVSEPEEEQAAPRKSTWNLRNPGHILRRFFEDEQDREFK